MRQSEEPFRKAKGFSTLNIKELENIYETRIFVAAYTDSGTHSRQRISVFVHYASECITILIVQDYRVSFNTPCEERA